MNECVNGRVSFIRPLMPSSHSLILPFIHSRIDLKKTITVEGNAIALLTLPNKEDYLSLTDLAKRINAERPADLVSNWMRNADNLEFLEVWEKVHNPNFNLVHLDEVKKDVGKNRFIISPGKWIETTNAIGLVVKTGRYGGGTFAHRDIAMAFCLWLSPPFMVYVVKEFQRLKEVEAAQNKDALDWNLRRVLAKVNYQIHTDTVRQHLVPTRVQRTNFEGIYYAGEADLLNLAVFGCTAAQWRQANPDLRGNLRDQATTEQLLVLANLESLNAELIRMKLSREDRLRKLNEVAIYQMEILLDAPAVRQLGMPSQTTEGHE